MCVCARAISIPVAASCSGSSNLQLFFVRCGSATTEMVCRRAENSGVIWLCTLFFLEEI